MGEIEAVPMKKTTMGIRLRLRLTSNDVPLYRRLPKRNVDGAYLADFMMLIPGLRNLAHTQLESRLATLGDVLENTREVAFADLNLPLNLLWVSIDTRNGAILELSARIRDAFPEARLVGHVTHDRPRAATPPVPRIEAGRKAQIIGMLSRWRNRLSDRF